MLTSIHMILLGRKRKTALLSLLGLVIVFFYIAGIVQNQRRLEKERPNRPLIIQHSREPRTILLLKVLNQIPSARPVNQPPILENSTKETPKSPKNDENIFVFGAFYDKRDPLGPRIRLLANLDCRLIQKTDISLRIKNQILPIEWMDLIGNRECQLDSGCKYVEVDLTSTIYEGPFPDMIEVLFLNSTQKSLKTQKLPEVYHAGLTVCQKPMHWYNDWVRLFIFIEWWRRNDASKILLSAHSISKTTKRLIEYYIRKGLVELRWIAEMPTNGIGDPNDQIYWGGEHLHEQLCSYRSETTYTALVDIDEFLYTRSRVSLYKFLDSRMRRGRRFGAFRFEHVPLVFKGDWISENASHGINFEILKKPITYDYWRMGKGVFVTEVTRLVYSHGVRQFFRQDLETMNISRQEAAYLHARNNFDESKASPANQKGDRLPIRLFEAEDFPIMKSTLIEIFGLDMPDYRFPETIGHLENCKKISLSHQRCQMPTGKICAGKMEKLDEWVFPSETAENKWTIL